MCVCISAVLSVRQRRHYGLSKRALKGHTDWGPHRNYLYSIQYCVKPKASNELKDLSVVLSSTNGLGIRERILYAMCYKRYFGLCLTTVSYLGPSYVVSPDRIKIRGWLLAISAAAIFQIIHPTVLRDI